MIKFRRGRVQAVSFRNARPRRPSRQLQEEPRQISLRISRHSAHHLPERVCPAKRILWPRRDLTTTDQESKQNRSENCQKPTMNIHYL